MTTGAVDVAGGHERGGAALRGVAAGSPRENLGRGGGVDPVGRLSSSRVSSPTC